MSESGAISDKQWFSAINETMSKMGIEGSFQTSDIEISDSVVTVSYTDQSGKPCKIDISRPELEAGMPIDTLSDDEFEAIKAKALPGFDGIPEAFEEGRKIAESGIPPSTPHQKMLFDIYQLMSLLIEITKSQREAARKTRQAELTMAVADITARANEMRSTAKTALIMSCVFAGVSVLTQAVSGGLQIKASHKAASLEAQTQANIEQTNENVSLLSAENQKIAQNNFDKACDGFDKACSNMDNGGNAQTLISERFGCKPDGSVIGGKEAGNPSNPAKTELLKAQNEFVQANSEFKTATAASETANGKFENAEANLKNAGNDEVAKNAAKTELETATAEKTAADGNLKTATEKRDAAVKRLDEAQEKYAKALDKDQMCLEADFITAKNDLAEAKAAMEMKDGSFEDFRDEYAQAHGIDPENKNTVTIKFLEDKVAIAKQARYCGKAYVVNEKMKAGGACETSLSQDFQKADNIVGSAQRALKTSTEYIKATTAATAWGTVGTLFKQLGDVGMASAQYTNSMGQSSASLREGAQKEHEAAREESNDLAASAKELLKSVLDLLAAIQSSENQTIRSIMA